MDSELFSEGSYRLYIMFMAVLHIYILQFSDLLKANSIKPIVVALFLFAANFFIVAWPGFIPNYPNPILFYTTMISAPAALLYTLDYIRQLLKAKDDRDYLPM